jgi:alpha-mannosidase
VAIRALKRCEDGKGTLVRLQELEGRPATATLRGAAIREARETDGLERPLGPLAPRNGRLELAFTPFQTRTLALTLDPPARLEAPRGQPLRLPYDVAAFSTNARRMDGAMEPYASYPAEMFPSALAVGGVPFTLGPLEDGARNALACAGQTLALPAGTRRVHLLLASAQADARATFTAGVRMENLDVPRWTGFLGSWDDRVFKGEVYEKTYSVDNDLERIAPAWFKEARPAWWASHRHAKGQDDVYAYSYFFHATVDVPEGATTLLLPRDPGLRLFAATAASLDNLDARPLQRIFPDLDRDASFGERFGK